MAVVKIFMCAECQNSFDCSKQFIRHMRYCHFTISKFRCGFVSCSKSFSSYDCFRAHVNRQHRSTVKSSLQKINNKLDTAPSCSKTPSALQDHCQRDHKADQQDHNRPDCNLGFEVDKTDVPEFPADQKTELNNSPYLIFASKLHSYPDVCRTRAAEIITDVTELTNGILIEVENNVLNALSSLPIPDNVLMEIKSSFKNSCESFQDVKSTWHCFKMFKKNQAYIPPEQYVVGERRVFVQKKKRPLMKMISVTAQFIPIRLVLKKFFETSGLQ